MKKTKIEDALRRLEEVTLEEARMAAAESLKAVHGVGSDVRDTLKAVEDRMRGMEGVLQGVGDKLQGVDDRMKNMSDKTINSTPTVPFVIRLPSLMWLGGEKTGAQMPKYLDVVALDGLKTTHGIDDEVQHVHDTREAVRNREIDVDGVQNTVQDIGSRVINGAQVIHNQLFMPF